MKTKRDTTVDLSRCSDETLRRLCKEGLIQRRRLYTELCARHTDRTVAEVGAAYRERDTLPCIPIFDTDPHELRAP